MVGVRIPPEGCPLGLWGSCDCVKSDFFACLIPPGLRCSIRTTFNIFWRSPKPVSTKFLLTHGRPKYMQNYQGFQNPPNPIRKKSAQLELCRRPETVTGPDPAKPAYRWDCGGVERATLSLRILTCFRCSIGVTFKTVQRLPAPKPTIFLLTHPKLKNMCFGQGYQNPPNPIRKKSAQLGRGQLPVRRPDQTHQIFGHRMGEDLNRKMDPKKVLKYLMPPYM